MTLPSEIFRNDYSGNDTTDTYAYTFKVFNKDHLKVIISDTILLIDDVELVEGVDYTVTGVGQVGGSIILVDGTGLLVGGFLPTGKDIAIVRNVAVTQEYSFRNQGEFLPHQFEDALDYITMVMQQLQDGVNRSLRVLESQPADADSLVFPSIAERANMLLGFDDDGNPIAVSAGGAVSGSWQTLIDAANYIACRTLIGFAGTGGTVETANIAPAGLAAAALATDAVTTVKIQALAVTTAKLADAAVTYAKMAANGKEYMASSGDIKATASSSVQSGWLLCDGSPVSRTTYADLFTAIGSAYGEGDGATTFNLPNLKGRFLRGIVDYANVNGSGSAASDNGTFTAHPYRQTGIPVRLSSGTLSGLSTATTYWVIVIDANTLAFASTRANALAGTKVAITGANSAVIMQYEDPDASTRVASTVNGNVGDRIGTYEEEAYLSHTHSVYSSTAGAFGATENVVSNGVPTATSGASGGTETRPKNVAVNFIIKT